MAIAAKSYDLDAIDRAWVAKALETQRQVLVRSLAKEHVGSEIYQLRQKEIDALTRLRAKFD